MTSFIEASQHHQLQDKKKVGLRGERVSNHIASYRRESDLEYTEGKTNSLSVILEPVDRGTSEPKRYSKCYIYSYCR